VINSGSQSAGQGPDGPRPVPALSVDGISKAFGATHALRDVSFSVARGRVHALLGGNGSGKSTLIKILAGVEQADGGSITLNGEQAEAAATDPGWARRNGLHVVHQDVGVFPELSVAENFALGAGHGERALSPIRWRGLTRATRQALDRFDLDVDPSMPMRELSGAMRTLVAVARALRDESADQPGVLILDEPTATLPAHEAHAVLDAVEQYAARGHAVVFVTHRLDEVLRVADDATFLRDGQHIETRSVLGLDHDALAKAIAGIVHNPGGRHRTATRRTRLRLQDVATGPLSGVCLHVDAGEIVGLAGLVDSGCSTLLRAIFGAAALDDGTVEIDGTVVKSGDIATAISLGVAYLPADRAHEAAFNDQTIRMNLGAADISRYWRGWHLSREAEGEDAREAIKRHGVVASSEESLLSTLSGGNQQKVMLARWLALTPGVLLLDQPTQGVDVGARTALYALIREAAASGTAVLVSSAESRELVELCDRVVGVSGGAVSGEASGDDLTVERCSDLAHASATLERPPTTQEHL
jgi:ribose transport system ATP-binding protein